MKKDLSSLGKVLSRSEMQKINGGNVACITCPSPSTKGTLCSGGNGYDCQGDEDLGVIICTGTGSGRYQQPSFAFC